jgi:hypothetical protein
METIRYSGTAVVTIKYDGLGVDDRPTYSGKVEVDGISWNFKDLSLPFRPNPESAESFDRAAEDALGFASFGPVDGDVSGFGPVLKEGQETDPEDLIQALEYGMTHSVRGESKQRDLLATEMSDYHGDTAIIFRDLNVQDRYFEADDLLYFVLSEGT